MKKKIVLLLSLSLLLVSTIMAKPVTIKRPTRLYFSSALFNARELDYNSQFVKQLEKLGYRVTLPQRDGFDYKDLKNQITRFVSPKMLSATSSDLIYLLNIGVLIPDSDAVIANLDIPVDAGVIVEMTYAHLMGKKVIGIKTGDRNPFNQANLLGGIHGFAGFQCDEIILMHPHEFNTATPKQGFKKLAHKIRQYVPTKQLNKAPVVNTANPRIKHIVNLAKRVIGNPKDIHTKKGLSRVVKNMLQNKSRVDATLVNNAVII